MRGHDGAVYAAAFSPDGTRVLNGSGTKTARIWRADGEGEAIVFRGHEGAVYTAVWSPDGARVLTSS